LGRGGAPATRLSDAGLAKQQTATPTWELYNPGSFPGSGPPGGWRLYPGKGWLIHEGTSTKEISGGSLGCIKIVRPGAWRRFLETLATQAGVDCATIGRRRLLTVVIEEAVRPAGTRVR
jgi:hypothetical protein